jgi:uncharacterized membrane protein
MSLIACMRFSKPRSLQVAAVALVTLSLLYPGIVYLSRTLVPASAFIVVALALIIARLATLRSAAERFWRMPLAAAAMTIAALAMLDAPLAVKAYPAAISLAASIVFGATLVHPPSMIERFASLREPELALAARRYCRRVTIVWTVWLIANTIVSAVLAIPGYDAAWAIWTGLVAYLVMGALFVGEIAIRRFLLARAART